MKLSRALVACVASLLGFGLALPVCAQTAQPAPGASAPSGPFGFEVPEWRSENGRIIVRQRARAIHDFYHITRDFDGTSNDGETSNDDLRALRFGVEGQFSPLIRFRADANLTSNQINWADVYIGYQGPKYEAFIGQHYMASAMETIENDPNFLLPEASLVNLAFGQNQRNFGAMVRQKGSNWQALVGVFHGNLNAGDIFGDDVLRYVQVRATYAPRNKVGDVLHLGVNLRARDAQKGPLLRYATRAAATNFGPRLLDSGAVASGDDTVSLEAMAIKGPWMLIVEHDLLWADTLGGTAFMSGTDVELRWWLTGETRRYVAGNGGVAPVRPKRSVKEGGPGAIALVARYDQVDQSDARLGVRAGRVQAATLGVAWTPMDFIMFRLAASHSRYRGPVAARNGTADVLTARAQFSF
jgi:phosphate-selective porin OprO and OprP